MWFLLVVVAVFGLAIGSFLNVVIYRVPNGQSLITPASRCPSCNTPIRHRHNVPVLGWLALRGRCADCAAPISVRYPLIESVTAVAFTLVTWRLHSIDRLPGLPAWLYFTAIAIALAAIDIDCHRLPNAIVLPSYPVLALLLAGPALWQQDYSALLRTAVGSAALFGGYFALALAYPKGMGFGDVKLAGLIGGMLGWLSYSALLVGAFTAFLLGGVAGVAVIASRRGSGKTPLPFGPFMLTAAAVALCLAQPLIDGYLDLTGL
ncbi:MAG TPA: prepilin peptidase [Jatrophihabitans sp.]|jgi:leader peptidase (prepilin peptidase)/N-methyltransferase|uniref:prepilin peptidase n=1 Tax=Jatrophihabitans sp. TaxID=1932789 RepID=UPI002EFB79A0